MIRIYILLCLLLCSCKVIPTADLPSTKRIIGSDRIEYSLSDNTLARATSPSAEYSHPRQLSIIDVDVTNTHKVMVLHSNTTITVLDNTLTPIQSDVQINDRSIDPIRIAQDNRGMIWLLDQANDRLIMLDVQGNVQIETVKLIDLHIAIENCTDFYYSKDTLVLQCGEETHYFDVYGNLMPVSDELKTLK